MSTPLQPDGHARNDEGDNDGTAGTTQPFDGDHNHHDDESDDWS